MIKKIQKQILMLGSLVVIGFSLLFVIKSILIAVEYSYAFLQMNLFHSLYYYFSLLQSDVLVLGLGLFFVRCMHRWKYLFVKWASTLAILALFAFYIVDLLVIFFFQQRLNFSSGASFLSAGVDVWIFYLFVFFLSFGAFIAACFGILRFFKILLTRKILLIAFFSSFVLYILPFPRFHFLGVELPEQNIVDKVLRTDYEISLNDSDLKQKDIEVPLKKLDISEEELFLLKKRKEFWLELANDHPEKVFQTFEHSSLQKATDEYGRDYVFDVLSAATKLRPELAFTSLSQYKNWENADGKTIVKPILEIAIAQEPELAFRYLDRYQNLVENNEKIAKPLLQLAIQKYKDPLTFDQLFYKSKGRKSKKNLILVFLESASSVDSMKFGGLNDRLPLLDKVSDDGRAFTQLHANGMSSDMGHVASLLGVEPIAFDYTGTRYQSYIGYAQPLGHFFNALGYTTTFLSTVSLDFLHQKDFLHRVGYKNIIGWEAFKDKKHYTFDAAPDGDLYDAAIDIVKKQSSPYFLTLQTISSHTPYNTPYGKTMEDMYRYEDETFAKFYEDLKKEKFFDNGVLIVIGDHRKMTPLEDAEFAKWGTTAAAKIVGFIIGKGIPKNQVDNAIYQQTDLFYSLLHEFGTGEVDLLQYYNDIFTRKISRNWSVKHRYDQKKVNIADTDGHYGYVDLNHMQIIDGKSYFPQDEILKYLQLSLDFQKQGQNSDFSSQVDDDKIFLISHRGDTKNAVENSLNAFKSARDGGADGIEFDLNVTKDGVLVVHHGPKIYNQTICKQEKRDICEMSFEEVQKCPLTDGQKMLTFEEALPLIKNWFPSVFIDIKFGGTCPLNKKALLEKAITLVQKNKMDAKVTFSSYDKELTSLLSKKPDVGVALDSYSLKSLDQLSGSYFSYFMTPVENFSKALVDSLHQKSVEGVAYVVNDPSALNNLKQMGVRFVMTDELAKLKKYLDTSAIKK